MFYGALLPKLLLRRLKANRLVNDWGTNHQIGIGLIMKVVMFERIVWRCLDGESRHCLGSDCKGFGIDLKTLFFVSFITSNWFRDAELLRDLHNWLNSSSASFQFAFMGSRLPCSCLPIVSQASCFEIRTASYRPHEAFDAVINTYSARLLSIDHWKHIGRRQND